VDAAEGIIAATMKRDGACTARDLAEAEAAAGLLFDPKAAADIDQAAREQTAAACQAEMQDLSATAAHFKGQLDGLAALLAGRRDTDLMLVSEIMRAVDPQATPQPPVTVHWTGTVSAPHAGLTTVVPCTTSRGGPAELQLRPEERLVLGSALLADLHLGPDCHTPGCGLSAAEMAEVDAPLLFSWIQVHVAGTDDGPRWHCTPWCALAAITAAAAEIAAADQAAAVDPAQQDVPASGSPEYAQFAEGLLAGAAAVGDQEDDVTRCIRCGCTEENACEGGCAWVPNVGMVDVCTGCATATELRAAGIPVGTVMYDVTPQVQKLQNLGGAQ
jgi:hypothetical protein